MTTLGNEKLKSEIFEITTGNLLGDGNLQKPSGCKYYRLRFAQNSIRKDYVIHLLQKYKYGLKIKDYSKTKYLIKREKPRIYSYKTKINKLNKQSYAFETRISSAFNQHADIFYCNGLSKKSLCNNLDIFYKILTPKALAYWYMDDGMWPNKKANSFQICTHAYTEDQVQYICKVLNKKFNLIATLRFNKQQPIIYISAKSYNIFKDLIYDTLIQIPSMQNKFKL